MGPGMKSKRGSNLARTPFRSASNRPSCSGTHVPKVSRQHLALVVAS